jgi:glycosyltransferase involved in cell wall biosynthesis
LSDLNKFGLVIPTLGDRLDYLSESLKSIIESGCSNILIIAPHSKIEKLKFLESDLVSVISEQGGSQVAAINEGFSLFPSSVEFVGWLGDDDLIFPAAMTKACELFVENEKIVATFGKCIYINSKGEEILRNNSGKWALTFMHFLPNLIPQPGSFFRRSAFEHVGGLNNTYPLAFDFELFFKLKKLGKVVYIPEIVSAFRWHPDSLSVDLRKEAVKQTSKIRSANSPKFLRIFTIPWEKFLQFVTFKAGQRVSRKS